MAFSGKNFSDSPPNLYNMGGLNPQTGKKPLFWAGFDWLTLNLSIEWAETWQTERVGAMPLRPLLLDALAAAQEKGEALDVPELGGKIHPGGGKIGGKKYCKFRIERKDAIILIADAQKYSGDWPNVKVEISGDRCLIFPGGAEGAYRSAVNWLESIGARIHRERVSRVDICADFPGMSIEPFYRAYQDRHWQCRAKRHHPDHSNGKSLYFGANEIVLRIYNKLAEMQASALRGKPAFYEHMIQKRWGGIEPDFATRVEFQLRREWLKFHGADTVDDLMRLASDFIGYLTGATENGRWFRFLCDVPDRKHPERNDTFPMWKVVQKAFSEVFRYPERLVDIDPDRADIETLVKQAVGVMETAMANKGFPLPWKDTCAPAKYKEPTFEQFMSFCAVMFRSAAVSSGNWKFEEKLKLNESNFDTAYLQWVEIWAEKQKQKQKGMK